MCPHKRLSKNFFSEKLVFLELFWFLSGKLSGFRPKTFFRVVETAFDVSRGTFWRFFAETKILKLFPDFWQIFRQIFGKYLSMVVKIAFYESRETSWGRNICWKHLNVQYFSGLRAQKLQIFEENFSAQLSKLHFTYRDDHFIILKKGCLKMNKMDNIVQHERNLQTSGKKRHHLSGWFSFHFL